MTQPCDMRGGAGRILVVCTRYIGDTALAIPFLRNLRAAFPDAVIDVCAEGGCPGGAGRLPLCRRVRGLATSRRTTRAGGFAGSHSLPGCLAQEPGL